MQNLDFLKSHKRLDWKESPSLDLIIWPYGFGGTDNLAQEGAYSILGDTELTRTLESLNVKVNLIEPPSLGPFEIQEHALRIRNIEAIISVNNWLREQVFFSRGLGHIPIVLGGDASLSIASLSGLMKFYQEHNLKNKVGCLWFSNHFGNSSPEVTKSWNANRMAFTALTHTDLGNELHEDFKNIILANQLTLPIISRKNIVHIGINHRSAQDSVSHNYFSMEDVSDLGINSILEKSLENLNHCEHIHLIFDLNAFDLSGVSNYSLGQLNYREVLSIARYIDMKLRRENKLSSIDIVEHCPSREAWDKRGESAEWVADLLENIFGANLFNVARKY
jgi:arginase